MDCENPLEISDPETGDFARGEMASKLLLYVDQGDFPVDKNLRKAKREKRLEFVRGEIRAALVLLADRLREKGSRMHNHDYGNSDVDQATINTLDVLADEIAEFVKDSKPPPMSDRRDRKRGGKRDGR